MAVFSIEIADEDVARVIGAVCANYNRPDTVPNPAFDPEQEESEENSEDNSEANEDEFNPTLAAMESEIKPKVYKYYHGNRRSFFIFNYSNNWLI